MDNVAKIEEKEKGGKTLGKAKRLLAFSVSPACLALSTFLILFVLPSLLTAFEICPVEKLPTKITIEHSRHPRNLAIGVTENWIDVEITLTWQNPDTGESGPMQGKEVLIEMTLLDKFLAMREGGFLELTSSPSQMLLVTDEGGKIPLKIPTDPPMFPIRMDPRKISYSITANYAPKPKEPFIGSSAQETYVPSAMPPISMAACMPLLVVLALLMAAMYASGRNPFAFLDISRFAFRGPGMRRAAVKKVMIAPPKAVEAKLAGFTTPLVKAAWGVAKGVVGTATVGAVRATGAALKAVGKGAAAIAPKGAGVAAKAAAAPLKGIGLVAGALGGALTRGKEKEPETGLEREAAMFRIPITEAGKEELARLRKLQTEGKLIMPAHVEKLRKLEAWAKRGKAVPTAARALEKLFGIEAGIKAGSIKGIAIGAWKDTQRAGFGLRDIFTPKKWLEDRGVRSWRNLGGNLTGGFKVRLWSISQVFAPADLAGAKVEKDKAEDALRNELVSLGISLSAKEYKALLAGKMDIKDLVGKIPAGVLREYVQSFVCTTNVAGKVAAALAKAGMLAKDAKPEDVSGLVVSILKNPKLAEGLIATDIAERETAKKPMLFAGEASVKDIVNAIKKEAGTAPSAVAVEDLSRKLGGFVGLVRHEEKSSQRVELNDELMKILRKIDIKSPYAAAGVTTELTNAGLLDKSAKPEDVSKLVVSVLKDPKLAEELIAKNHMLFAVEVKGKEVSVTDIAKAITKAAEIYDVKGFVKDVKSFNTERAIFALEKGRGSVVEAEANLTERAKRIMSPEFLDKLASDGIIDKSTRKQIDTLMDTLTKQMRDTPPSRFLQDIETVAQKERINAIRKLFPNEDALEHIGTLRKEHENLGKFTKEDWEKIAKGDIDGVSKELRATAAQALATFFENKNPLAMKETVELKQEHEKTEATIKDLEGRLGKAMPPDERTRLESEFGSKKSYLTDIETAMALKPRIETLRNKGSVDSYLTSQLEKGEVTGKVIGGFGKDLRSTMVDALEAFETAGKSLGPYFGAPFEAPVRLKPEQTLASLRELFFQGTLGVEPIPLDSVISRGQFEELNRFRRMESDLFDLKDKEKAGKKLTPEEVGRKEDLEKAYPEVRKTIVQLEELEKATMEGRGLDNIATMIYGKVDDANKICSRVDYSESTVAAAALEIGRDRAKDTYTADTATIQNAIKTGEMPGWSKIDKDYMGEANEVMGRNKLVNQINSYQEFANEKWEVFSPADANKANVRSSQEAEKLIRNVDGVREHTSSWEAGKENGVGVRGDLKHINIAFESAAENAPTDDLRKRDGIKREAFEEDRPDGSKAVRYINTDVAEQRFRAFTDAQIKNGLGGELSRDDKGNLIFEMSDLGVQARLEGRTIIFGKIGAVMAPEEKPAAPPAAPPKEKPAAPPVAPKPKEPELFKFEPFKPAEYEVKVQKGGYGETFKPSQEREKEWEKEEKSKVKEIVKSYQEDIKTLWGWMKEKVKKEEKKE